MAAEVFWDTSGFFALLDQQDAAHRRVVDWIESGAGRRPAVTTEWIIGETSTTDRQASCRSSCPSVATPLAEVSLRQIHRPRAVVRIA